MISKLFLAATAICLCSYYPTADTRKAFRKLHALEGVWKMNGSRAVLCEEWKKIGKNYLHNKGYLVKGSDTTVTERVALTRTKEGIFYTSTVEDQNNKKPIVFKMTSATGNTFVFENPAHDFPKRIVYQIVSGDSLHAWIDDAVEGTKKVRHFYYTRQKQ